MSAAYTPGPWHVEFGMAQGGEGHHVCDSKGMESLSVLAVVLFHDDADGETKANAALIAAAPELLEALDSLRAAVVQFTDAAKYNDWPELDAARAAIAKATGRAL